MFSSSLSSFLEKFAAGYKFCLYHLWQKKIPLSIPKSGIFDSVVAFVTLSVGRKG
jgi:hypothetical protein